MNGTRVAGRRAEKQRMMSAQVMLRILGICRRLRDKLREQVYNHSRSHTGLFVIGLRAGAAGSAAYGSISWSEFVGKAATDDKSGKP